MGKYSVGYQRDLGRTGRGTSGLIRVIGGMCAADGYFVEAAPTLDRLRKPRWVELGPHDAGVALDLHATQLIQDYLKEAGRKAPVRVSSRRESTGVHFAFRPGESPHGDGTGVWEISCLVRSSVPLFRDLGVPCWQGAGKVAQNTILAELLCWPNSKKWRLDGVIVEDMKLKCYRPEAD